MATKERCVICTEKRNVKLHLGRMVCASCAIVQSYASKKPEVVLRALAEFDNLPMAEVGETEAPDLSEEARRAAGDNGSHYRELLKRVDELEQMARVIRFGELVLRFGGGGGCLKENGV